MSSDAPSAADPQGGEATPTLSISPNSSSLHSKVSNPIHRQTLQIEENSGDNTGETRKSTVSSHSRLFRLSQGTLGIPYSNSQVPRPSQNLPKSAPRVVTSNQQDEEDPEDERYYKSGSSHYRGTFTNQPLPPHLQNAMMEEDPQLMETISELSDLSESFMSSTLGSFSISSRVSIMGMIQRRHDKTLFEALDRQWSLRRLLAILGVLPYDRHLSLASNLLIRLYYYFVRIFFVGIYLPYTIYLWARYNRHHSAYDDTGSGNLSFTYVVNNFLFTNLLVQALFVVLIWYQVYDRLMTRLCCSLDALIMSKMQCLTWTFWLYALGTTLIYPIGAHCSQYVSVFNTTSSSNTAHADHAVRFLASVYTPVVVIGQIIVGQALTVMVLFFLTDTNISLMLMEETSDLITHQKLSVPTTMQLKTEIHARLQYSTMFTNSGGYSAVTLLSMVSTVGFILRLYVHEGAIGALYLALLYFFKEIPIMILIGWRAMKLNERSNWMMRFLGESCWEESLELTRALIFVNLSSYPMGLKVLGWRLGYRSVLYPLVVVLVTIAAGFIRILVQTHE